MFQVMHCDPPQCLIPRPDPGVGTPLQEAESHLRAQLFLRVSEIRLKTQNAHAMMARIKRKTTHYPLGGMNSMEYQNPLFSH